VVQALDLRSGGRGFNPATPHLSAVLGKSVIHICCHQAE